MEDTALWLWLANGLGPCVSWLEVWRQYGDIRAIWEDRLHLLAKGLLSQRQSDRLLTAGLDAAYRRLELHREKDITVLTWGDAAYPELLRNTTAPPPVLYCKGDVAHLSAALPLGVVGTRRPSAYGLEATRQICEGLAGAGAVIVSGLAEGLDSEAHKAALRKGTPTVAVLGTDLETVYPARNRELQALIARTGTLVSEYPCTGADVRYKESFVQRNRIIAGLSRGLCVAEARLRSGTMSTVRYAGEYGRDIFAVPGSIFSALSEGTNQLIKQGAKPVTCASDVLEEYGRVPAAPEKPKAEPAEMPQLEGDLKTVYDALAEGGKALDAAEIAERTHLAPAKLLSALTRLEMRGLVRQRPGRRFEKAL